MIKVVDSIMGSGKSSAVINYMNSNPSDKYLYVTPYNAEALRIADACPDLHFILPSNKNVEAQFKKSNHLRILLNEGRNVAISHELLSYADEDMCDALVQGGYTVFIDEAVEVFSAGQKEFSSEDIDILRDANRITLEGNVGGCEYFSVAEGVTYTSCAYRRAFNLLKSRRIARVGNDVEEDGTVTPRCVYWAYHKQMFELPVEMYVLTYLFEGSYMSAFFDINGIEYTKIGVRKTEDGEYEFADKGTLPEYAKHLKDKVHVVTSEKLNEIGEHKFALSASWMKDASAHMRDGRMLQLKNNLTCFFNSHAKQHPVVPNEDRLWTCIGKAAKDKLRGKGYTRRHIAFNARATNDYKNCTALAYCANVFPHSEIVRFINTSTKFDPDLYALGIMVQWVWRSAIRDGEEVYLYVPSRRMRELFVGWMESLAEESKEDGLVAK